MFTFKMIECCSKDYKVRHVNITSVLQSQHQWELEQKKTNDSEAPKVDTNKWAKTMENIVLHLKLMRGMRGALLAYVVQRDVNIAHTPPGYGKYLTLDKEMIARGPIIDASSNLRLNQDSLDRIHVVHQADTFKVDNAFVYQILSKIFTDMDTFVYVKQRRAMQDSPAVFFNIHKNFLGPNHVARNATDAEGRLQNSHYDGARNTWHWDKYVALYKE